MLVTLDILCLWAMVPISRLLQLSPPPLSFTRFSPGLLVLLQEIVYQPSFALLRLLQKKFIFKVKQIFSFNLLLAGFGFAAFCVIVS